MVVRSGVRVSSSAKNGASSARCTAEPMRLAAYTMMTVPSSSASSRVNRPRWNTTTAPGRARTATKTVSDTESASMIRSPCLVSRFSSAGFESTADSRGRSVTITERKNTVPPTALIRR